MKYELNEVFNEDCVEAMKAIPDNYFQLAICDPPYGIGESKNKRENTRTDKWNNPTQKIHTLKDWDLKTPPQEYFDELFRVSNDQIIWGGNYFIDKIKYPSMGWVFWDKKNGNSDFSDGELAYTSFNKGLRKFEWLWNGFQKQRPEKRIHPTQKPVQLYKWLLQNYAKPDMKILDTHLGSASSILAMIDFGCDWMAFETDKEYYDNAIKRINNHIRKPQMDFEQTGKTYEQLTIDQ
jgi:site-specific DNA-methyltransferase (adenine-specific)